LIHGSSVLLIINGVLLVVILLTQTQDKNTSSDAGIFVRDGKEVTTWN
jgi:hypothetical protein